MSRLCKKDPIRTTLREDTERGRGWVERLIRFLRSGTGVKWSVGKESQHKRLSLEVTIPLQREVLFLVRIIFSPPKGFESRKVNTVFGDGRTSEEV